MSKLMGLREFRLVENMLSKSCSVSAPNDYAKLGLQCVSNIFITHPLAIIKGDNIPDTR